MPVKSKKFNASLKAVFNIKYFLPFNFQHQKITQCNVTTYEDIKHLSYEKYFTQQTVKCL